MSFRHLTLLVAVAAGCSSFPAQNGGGQTAYTPEGLGRALYQQQAGVDEASSFLLEWEVFFPDEKGEGSRRFSLAWRDGHSHYHDVAGATTNTVWVCSGTTTTLHTSGNAEAEALIFASIHPDALSLGRAWVFFPVFSHFWDKISAEARIRQEWSLRPQLLRLIVEAREGRTLSDAEVLRLMLKRYANRSGEGDMEFAAVPADTHEAPEGRIAVGCRVRAEPWFSIVELDEESLRLERLITFVNKEGMPDDAVRQLGSPRAMGVAERWELQENWAFAWRRIEYSEHRELPLGVIVPMRVDLYSRREGVTHWDHASYRVTRAEVNPALADDYFEASIPDGAWVVDFSHDPLGLEGIRYRQDKRRGDEDWEGILREGKKRVNDELERRRQVADMVGRPAPELSASVWIGTSGANLAELKGRYVILLFSSVYCGPCVREAPRLPALLERLEAGNGLLVGVFAAGNPREEVRAFARNNGLQFPICISSGEAWGDVFKAYHVPHIPSACLVDQDGRFLAEGDPWHLADFVREMGKLSRKGN